MTDLSAMQNTSLFRAVAALSALLAGTALSAPIQADAPNVVTTIKPVHSIAAAVMDGVGTPHILIDGAASPHGFALKPSQAFLLQGADAVFWIGPELTPSLAKPVSSMAASAVRIELLDAEGIKHLDFRDDDQFEGHDHEDHGSHDDHGHDDHKDHDKSSEHQKAESGHGHDHGKEHAHEEIKHEHEHEGSGKDAHHDEHEDKHTDSHQADGDGHDHAGGKDPHIWLNPDNGIAIAQEMAKVLAGLDPENAAVYQANAAKFADSIAALDQENSAKLAPVKGQKFIVFHDAYHHFEHHYGIEASGAITVTPEALSSADRVSEIQSRVREQSIICVFQEPQFDAKLVNVVIEGSDAKVGILDPLGTELANGPNLYPALLTGLANSLVGCLK